MKLNNDFLEYFKDYADIKFRVEYSYNKTRPEEISFAAQPYENMDTEEHSNNPQYFLMYGKVNFHLSIEVGFREFSFEMTKDLHNRIGKLYDAIRNEFLDTYKDFK